ncbi:antibiotic biosynthesis monooxygenase family protein [Flagellimonas sediminis]|uniref:Antibiotic biosynthesis monooxygenase n=1 Tax=Flagellimonas sediminis TaxID=2696468 RepID=A0A6I5KNY8_9FLAO|nr:antibiotic biosynthesis monooxygenase [Allomuricauda sediminis]NDV42406.1 antibiotic biosynthesis monooxygenase [Allomuricauda sediminis]
MGKFIVIYKFQVKKGLEKDFEKDWEKLTHAFVNYSRGLGSRLHMDPSGIYIAYAQWPDQSTWTTAGSRLPEHAKALADTMRAKCENVEVLFTLDEIKNLLKTDGPNQ